MNEYESKRGRFLRLLVIPAALILLLFPSMVGVGYSSISSSVSVSGNEVSFIISNPDSVIKVGDGSYFDANKYLNIVSNNVTVTLGNGESTRFEAYDLVGSKGAGLVLVSQVSKLSIDNGDFAIFVDGEKNNTEVSIRTPYGDGAFKMGKTSGYYVLKIDSYGNPIKDNKGKLQLYRPNGSADPLVQLAYIADNNLWIKSPDSTRIDVSLHYTDLNRDNVPLKIAFRG